jgi:hypothetical protein
MSPMFSFFSLSMSSNTTRIPLNTNIFPNYLGVVLSHYCPLFLAGHTAEEIHFSLNWLTLVQDNGTHNCFYWPCWAFKICPTTESSPIPFYCCSHWHCVYCDCANFIEHFTPFFLPVSLSVL